MPTISNKALSIQSSPIRKLVPFANAAKARGTKVYHLNIGQPDIPSPPQVFDALKNLNREYIEYAPSDGIKSYKEKLAGYYQDHGINVSADEIMITTGGSEAIQFMMLALFNQGDELIVPEPFYANYNGFGAMAGVKVVPIESKIEDGFALPDISEFEKAINPKTKGIMICNPNNPTGYLYSRDELEKLKEVAIKYDLYLFADEVYREFVYDGKKHTSILELDGASENIVVLDSVSKRYNMCGARIGAIITRNQEVLKNAMRFAQTRLSPPTLGQIVAEAAIDTPDSYFQSVRDEYVSRRNLVVESLNKMDGVFSPNPGGAFYTIARMPIDSSEKFCQWLLEEFEYEGQTVMFAPASGFYATEGSGNDEVRIAYVLKKEDLEKAMKVLEEALKVYPGRK